MRAFWGAASLTWRCLVGIAVARAVPRSVSCRPCGRSRRPTRRTQRRTTSRRRAVRRGGEGRPGAGAGLLLPRQQLRQPVSSPAARARPRTTRCSKRRSPDYKTASEKLARRRDEDDKKLGKLSLEYLVAAYGPDKLNDPAQAEPVVQRMIQLEPNEPSNYFAAGQDLRGRRRLRRSRADAAPRQGGPKPNDPAVYMQLAGYYNRQNMFDKTIDALEQRAPRNRTTPRRSSRSPTYYWDNAQRELPPDRRREARQRRRRASTAVDKAHRDQGGLHGGARLQGPAPSRPGAPREGPGQAAGAHQGSRPPCAIRPRSFARSAATGVKAQKSPADACRLAGARPS